MHNIGIICEYNPFHNGHLYHLEQIKKMFPESRIILIMSGNFTQRGDISVLNKWDKTEIALFYGVDLVIELPFIFATQGADVFAKASIELLNHLHTDYLVFGSESNQLEQLILLAKIQIENKQYQKIVRQYIKEGSNYPTALSKALYALSGIKIKEPNDILGLTYIREIIQSKSSIQPLCISRNNHYNSTTLEGTISSATSIRYALQNKIDITPYVPSKTLDYLKNVHFASDYFPFLKYKILSEINELNKYQMVDEGIENRIKKFIVSSKSLDELILKVKTKRYTYNKINRMFIHILCGVTKEEATALNKIAYIRVLGFRKKGRELLKEVKKQIEIPIVTNFSNFKHPMLNLEFRSTCIYASVLNEKEKIKYIESEFKNSPIIK